MHRTYLSTKRIDIHWRGTTTFTSGLSGFHWFHSQGSILISSQSCWSCWKHCISLQYYLVDGWKPGYKHLHYVCSRVDQRVERYDGAEVTCFMHWHLRPRCHTRPLRSISLSIDNYVEKIDLDISTLTYWICTVTLIPCLFQIYASWCCIESR